MAVRTPLMARSMAWAPGGSALPSIAGVTGGWSDADRGQVAAFLQRWRVHRLATLQMAYLALHDLILGAWYGDSASWAAIGYPGPLAELS